MALDLARTDLREAVTDVVNDTASLRSAKRQECTLYLDDWSLAVVADGVRVRQILFNLLSNASKFTAEGGEITLSAVRTRAPLHLPADRAGDERRAVHQEVVWVSVADSGIGIAPGDMDKLFQEFSQVESSASRQAQGTGPRACPLQEVREDARRHHRRRIDSGPRIELLVHAADRGSRPAYAGNGVGRLSRTRA